jgi:hypothetical protein
VRLLTSVRFVARLWSELPHGFEQRPSIVCGIGLGTRFLRSAEVPPMHGWFRLDLLVRPQISEFLGPPLLGLLHGVRRCAVSHVPFSRPSVLEHLCLEFPPPFWFLCHASDRVSAADSSPR